MKRRGPDSLEGLFIALICCLISTLMYGLTGLSSMMFVACITRYNTDRNKASLPFVLSNVLQAMSGPFTGYLAKRFGVRIIVLAGSVFAFLGIGACFFAEDITAVIICWGIIFGTGFGLSTLLLPVIINDYFFKQRSAALGVSYLGSPIGFFVFPPIFEVLLNKYGLSGTFLLLSGISLHCVPLSMLLRRPNFKSKNENSHLNCGNRINSYFSTEWRIPNQTQQPEFENSGNSETNSKIKTYFKRFSIEFLWKKSESTEQLTDGGKQYVLSLNKKDGDTSYTKDILRSFKKSSKNHYEYLDALSKSERTESQNKQLDYTEMRNNFNYYEHGRSSSKGFETIANVQVNKNTNCKKLYFTKDESYEACSTIYFGNFQKSHNFAGNKLNGKIQTNCNAFETCALEEKSHVKQNGVNNVSEKSNIPVLLKYRKIDEYSNHTKENIYDKEKSSIIQDIENTENSKNSMLNMYLNPIFILMCIINAIANLVFSTLTTVIIDFSRDLQIEVEYEKYIMMCISIMGGIGMLGFGWVTDGGYLRRTRFGSLSQLIGSVSIAVLPFVIGFETLMIPLSIWCICQSSFIPLIPAIIAEYFAEDIQTVAISACYVLSGPLYLIIPPLIGYFRDEKGSYNNIFFLLGILSLVNCIAVFIIPYLARWKSKR